MLKIKSIYQKLENCTEDSERIELLAELSTEFLNTDMKRCAEVVEQLGELARRINNPRAFGYYYSGLGRLRFKQSQFVDAATAFKIAIDYAIEANSPMLESNCYHSLGMVYWKEGLFEESLAVSIKSLEFFERIEDKTGNQALCHNNIGNIYERLGEFDKAEEAYLKGMEILETIGQDRVYFNVMGNLGVIKLRKEQYEEALKYLEPVYNGFKKLKHTSGESLTLVHLGHAFAGKREFAKAMGYYIKALKRLKLNEFKTAEADALRGIGNIYIALEGYNEALEHYQKGMDIANEIHNHAGICEFHIDMANTYQSMGDSAKAMEHVEMGLKLAKIKNLQREAKRLEDLKEQLLIAKTKVA